MCIFTLTKLSSLQEVGAISGFLESSSRIPSLLSKLKEPQLVIHSSLIQLTELCLLLPVSSDIDECAEGKHYCRENTMCVNTPGSFMCICHTGYIRIDDYSCTGESFG